MRKVISLLVCLICPGQSHVSLKYPPAREIDLDFLDSARTSGDCGMDAGSLRTSLEAGNSYILLHYLARITTPSAACKCMFTRSI